MCLAENEPGGPKRCDGHAEKGYIDARSKAATIIQEQGRVSGEIVPLEQKILRHRTTAETARSAGNTALAERQLQIVDTIDAELATVQGKYRKLTAQKTKAIQDLAEKRGDFYATSRGLQELQGQIDTLRVSARDESLSALAREEAAQEADRLQSLAGKSKARIDAEEQERLDNARRHGWEYQIKDTLPISEQGIPSTEDDGPQGRALRFANDRSVTMIAQGTVNASDPQRYDSFSVTLGNEEGKTATVDWANYATLPQRDASGDGAGFSAAPSRSEVTLALADVYASQRIEPNFDKHVERLPASSQPSNTEEYEAAKARWRSAARERARLKKILGDAKFEELLAVRA